MTKLNKKQDILRKALKEKETAEISSSLGVECFWYDSNNFVPNLKQLVVIIV